MFQLTITADAEAFEPAAGEYRQIWSQDGDRIIKTFTEVTGLDFKQESIEVIVYEGPSFSGNRTKPMKLRASLDYEVKQGTLLHELAHRLISPLPQRIETLDEHQTLNLYLYDVWSGLYGQDFATMMVEFESNLQGTYNYKATWQWFLKLSATEKKTWWETFKRLNQN